MRDKELITIPCPKCGKNHTYRIAVEQTVIMAKRSVNIFTILFGLLTLPFQFLFEKFEKPTTYTFTRLFTCPTKHIEFQAVFELSSINYPIRNVEVLGTTSENDER